MTKAQRKKHISNLKISIEYYNCLERAKMEEFIWDLKQQGADIWITCWKYDGYTGFFPEPTAHLGLLDCARRLRIPSNQIKFTNGALKCWYFNEEGTNDFDIHIDPNWKEMFHINGKTNVPCIVSTMSSKYWYFIKLELGLQKIPTNFKAPRFLNKNSNLYKAYKANKIAKGTWDEEYEEEKFWTNKYDKLKKEKEIAKQIAEDFGDGEDSSEPSANK
jgi:hypothetical protein